MVDLGYESSNLLEHSITLTAVLRRGQTGLKFEKAWDLAEMSLLEFSPVALPPST